MPEKIACILCLPPPVYVKHSACLLLLWLLVFLFLDVAIVTK